LKVVSPDEAFSIALMECSHNDVAVDCLEKARENLGKQIDYEGLEHSLIQKMDVPELTRLSNKLCEELDLEYGSYQINTDEITYNFIVRGD